MGTLFETNKKTNPMRERILFVQLYMGLIFIMSGNAASCPIELSQHRVVVKHGDPVSVNCSTSESNFTGIGWEASRGGTGIRPVNHLLWTVNSLTEWSISPVCFFSQHPEDICTRELEVIVYKFPETIKISSSSAHSNLMSEGETHSFTCHIPKIAPLQNLTVRWYKGDTVLQTDTLHRETREPLNSSSVFSFTATKEDHGARFKCEAHMDLGPEGPQFNATSHEFIANVGYGPYIECPTIELREGESLKGKCNVMGNPTPEVTWFKDGQWINLTTPLRRNDGGIYTVKAEGFSSAEEAIQVNVLYGPEKTCPEGLDVVENTPTELICTQGFPTPKEIWYKDDEEVEFPKIFSKNEEGLYWVNASNAHSSVNLTVEIIVLYPPSPIRDLEDTKVNVGDDMGLTCSSKGNPRPKYSWSYNHRPNVEEKTEDGVSRLIILNATRDNAGYYTCQAYNEGGKVSRSVKVTVEGDAASCPIKMSQHRVVVKHGDPVSVNCSTSESNFTGIGWEASRGGTGIRPVNHLLWTVNSLTEWLISPVCFFSQHPGDVCMRELEVIVYKFPETIEISSSSAHSNQMSEGENHNFTCHIPKIAPLQNLTVRWYKGDTVRQTDTLHRETREPLNSSSVFSLTATKEDHGARFKCEAHMDLGPEGPQFNATSHEFIANVGYGPHIECPTIELREGESLKGKCNVMGNPTPEVTWLKDGQRINLTTPLRRNDGGIYTVKAEGFSSAEEAIQVNVLYGPEKTCPDRLDVVENTPTELICTQGFPTPKEIWYKDDEEVEFPKIFTKNEEGLYWVNASNAHSSVDLTVEIIVLYPPSPIRDLEDTKVNVGDDMGLTCSSKGNPRPKYSWSYNHRPNVEEKTEDGVSRLIILNATRDNAGYYTCQAYNEGGKVSRSVKVTVEGDAASCPIKLSQHRVVVKHGDPVSVNCSTSESNFTGIGWEASRGGTGIRPVNHLLWTVNSLIEWSISPVCFFSQHPGDVCMRELEVVVYKFPETIEISSSSAHSNLMSEGETHNFTCHIPKIAPLQNLTVRWYKGDTVLQTDTLHRETREPLNSSSVFSFTATKEDHDARFKCEAHMDLGPEGPQFNATSHEFIAKVEYGPYIECPTIELREGESLKGKCNVMGNPTPEVTWLKDGQRINLTTPLRRNDGGIYTVKAEGFSSAEEAIQVNVLYSPVETTWDVSIRAMYNTNLVVEDRELQLKCDIVSSGPIRVQNLTVWGFRGNDSVKLAESNTSSCEGVSVGLPGNFSCTVNITLKRAHSGLQIRCEAQFEPGEQQSPQNAMSQPLNISVMYQPEINTTKLPDAIPLFRGYPEELVCEADGNPPPNITWIHSSPTAQTGSGGKLSVFDPGLYTCTAENPVNSTTYSVQVFLKEDYLPLIAGFVAVTVVAISVVFLFIYSIYYKNTKMRRYNLKNAKLSTQNGNVAHNGWDMQFPITKLS